ncbi:MAG: efflux RND transporter periplasmic adaptor subunit [Syntrophobacterales bacterium]|nr:efflux RND transporter periplasmic adaptor subunit [Syntrophobacterales bacterium]
MSHPEPSAGRAGRPDQIRRFLHDRKYHLLAVLALLAVFLAGVLYGSFRGQAPRETRRILYYVDPMNPAHTSPEPGLAPCGMPMEPVYAEGPEEAPPPFLAPGAVRITPEKQQLLGVRLGVVEKVPHTHRLRTLARVAADESRVYRLTSFLDGWVQTVHPYTTGSLVVKGEPLATLGSRDILNEVQLYLSTLGQLDRSPRGDRQLFVNYQVRVRRAEEALLNLGMSPAQIQELTRTRRYTQEVELAAPATSFVLARNLSPGQRVSKGDELYRLANLSRVWLVADLSEPELPFLTPGLRARGRTFRGSLEVEATVAEVPPEFDPVSRTFRARLETDNPGYALRPGMFLEVELPLALPECISVPVDAVLDTGRTRRVFVDRGNGYFEPRRVETGWRFGDRVEITRGLAPGERLVVSGNFLVDSESRMKLAAAGFAGEVARDPVTGVLVDELKARSAGLVSQHQGRTYYFHSEEAKRLFEQHPGRYLEAQAPGAAAPPPPAPGAVSPCPVCGHQVDHAQAKARGWVSDYQGRTYHFCRYACNREFDRHPDRFVSREGSAAAVPATPREEAPLIVRDPVCGLEVHREEAQARRLRRIYRGRDYYFCREWCARRFDEAPERYVPAVSPPPAGAPEPTPPLPAATPAAPASPPEPAPGSQAIDPVCGMPVDTTGEEVFQTLYEGRVYYFCSDRCKAQFDLDPRRYLKEVAAATAPESGAKPAPAPGAPPVPPPAPAAGETPSGAGAPGLREGAAPPPAPAVPRPRARVPRPGMTPGPNPAGPPPPSSAPGSHGHAEPAH